MPLILSSVDSVPAFATMLSMPRFSDVIVITGESSSPSFPNEPTPRSVSLSIARVARVRNRNQQCSYQVLGAARERCSEQTSSRIGASLVGP